MGNRATHKLRKNKLYINGHKDLNTLLHSKEKLASILLMRLRKHNIQESLEVHMAFSIHLQNWVLTMDNGKGLKCHWPQLNDSSILKLMEWLKYVHNSINSKAWNLSIPDLKELVSKANHMFHVQVKLGLTWSHTQKWYQVVPSFSRAIELGRSILPVMLLATLLETQCGMSGMLEKLGSPQSEGTGIQKDEFHLHQCAGLYQGSQHSMKSGLLKTLRSLVR